MAKHIKAAFYGLPADGKSWFACGFPKPHFITSDGNYEWLENHPNFKNSTCERVYSWKEAKNALANIPATAETVVLDLTEDLFKYCEQDFVKRSRLDHISDLGFGKGYDITRTDFFMEIAKLINRDVHVLLLMHGLETVTKDRRNVEHPFFRPTNRIPDKVLDQIEGRLRYFLRVYKTSELDENNNPKTVRRLSLIPKENEYGIARGLDESTVPHDIPLDANLFLQIVGITANTVYEKSAPEIKDEIDDVEQPTVKTEVKTEVNTEVKVEQPKAVEQPIVKTETKVVEQPKVEEPKVEEPKVEEQKQVEQPKVETQAEKLARLRAKIAANKKAN